MFPTDGPFMQAPELLRAPEHAVLRPGACIGYAAFFSIPCGSSTYFFAAPLSKSLYPCGASSSEITVAFTAFAICTLSCKIACISCR